MIDKGAASVCRMEQNAELLRAAKDGDESAKEQLVQQNMGLVRSVAFRFRDRGTELEDLIQIGSIGMIKAINSFDFSYQTAFSTYAVPLIIGEIRKHLRDDGMIKVGRRLKKQGAEILRAREQFEQREGREPRLRELAAETGLSEEEVIGSLDAVSPIRSLNERVSDDENGLTLEQLIGDREKPLDKLTDSIALSQIIRTLPDFQQKILYLRYEKEMSQQKTGEILGLSQVKISREEKKILAFLKKAL
ncbi:MAG: sigma-70 family RNA polymerase sigma factor [Ruminococcaceae bacterium]|nr:sigma-70 family RNA polymerase sigma factor [Oscillospiraceae bacterium]